MWNTQSGTAVVTFKGPVDAVSRTLCIVGTDYLLAAVRDKNLINLWSLQQTVGFITLTLLLVTLCWQLKFVLNMTTYVQ